MRAAGRPDIGSANASRTLESKVAEIRNLAEGRHAEPAHARLAELRALVEELMRRDELTDERARRIFATATQVEQRLALITPATGAQPPPLRDEEEDDE